MTREEAYVFNISDSPIDGVINTLAVVNRIDKIYDELESMTCKTCIYSIEEDGNEQGDIYRCELFEGDTYFNTFLSHDYGCNRWGAKDD